MRELPILFSAPMIRAILDRSKTQTRRVVKPQHDERINPVWMPELGVWQWATKESRRVPPWMPGDRLWVRETWCHKIDHGGIVHNANGDFDRSCVWYRATDPGVVKVDGDGVPEQRQDGTEASPWKPSIFMPRWASRITLLVKAVRVERLQGISEEDAVAEGAAGPMPCLTMTGVEEVGPATYREGFRELWDSINAKKHPWKSNRLVWVTGFEVIEPKLKVGAA